MRPTQTKPLPPETGERGLPKKETHADGFRNESQGTSNITQRAPTDQDPTRPTTADVAPDQVDPEAEPVEIYWARSLGRDEYGCPTYHLIAVIRCPHCRKTHNHGLGGTRVPADGTGGHRLAHCAGKITNTQGAHSRGYWITGLDQATVPAYPAATCRARRGAPQDGAP